LQTNTVNLVKFYCQVIADNFILLSVYTFVEYFHMSAMSTVFKILYFHNFASVYCVVVDFQS